MKPFIAFLKMQLNVNYGVSALKYRFTRDKKKLWEPILIGAVIILSFLPLAVLYTGLMLTVFAAGKMINQPEMVLVLSFMFAQLVIFIFGIFYILGAFYFSTDLESFVPLPLKPHEVVGGKFAVVLVNEYLTSVPVLLPPIIIYGAGMLKGAGYWLKSALLMIMAPVIPLAAATLFVMAIMRVANLRRHKDALAVIGGLLAIFLGVGFSALMQNVPEDISELQDYFAGRANLVDLIGSRFPPSIWASKGLSESGMAGIGHLLLFLAVCLLLVFLMMRLADFVFYRALLAGQEVGRKRKRAPEALEKKSYMKESGQVAALAKREWRELARTPVYLLNGLVGSFVGPLILVMMFFVRKNDAGLGELLEMAATPDIAPYFMLGGLGLMLFTAGMNLVASTSLSREGKTFWITKMIPVPAKRQVNAKIIVSLITSAIGIVVTGAMMLALFKLPLLWVLGAMLTGFAGSVPMTVLNLLIDVFHPKLVWNNEQEAMKQNMNGGLGMLVSILLLAVFGAVAALLLAMKARMLLIFIAINAVSAILGILSFLALYAVAGRKYRDLEA